MKLNKKTVIGLACAAAIISATAFALPAYYIERDYYSDASYTEVVGNSTLTCSGHFYLEGEQTSYSKVVLKFPC